MVQLFVEKGKDNNVLETKLVGTVVLPESVERVRYVILNGVDERATAPVAFVPLLHEPHVTGHNCDTCRLRSRAIRNHRKRTAPLYVGWMQHDAGLPHPEAA